MKVEVARVSKPMQLVATCILTFCIISIMGHCQDQGPASPSTSQDASASKPAFADAETKDLEIYRKEISNEDQTYFRPRTVLKYEHKFVPGGIARDEFRSFNLYSFGPRKRWAITAEMPYLMFISTPTGSSTGVGDAEFKFGTMFQKTEKFRQVVGVQLNTQTASDPLFGGTATIMKALYANSLVINTRWIVNFSWNYAHSVHLSEVASTVSQMEPEVTLSRSLPWFALYLHFDNYYDFPISQWGNTAKGGLSRAFGERSQWTINVFDEYGLNAYARSKFTHKVGIDVARYFGSN